MTLASLTMLRSMIDAGASVVVDAVVIIGAGAVVVIVDVGCGCAGVVSDGRWSMLGVGAVVYYC